MITRYEDLSVAKYLEIVAANDDEGLDEIERQVRIVSILSGVTEEELLHLPIEEYSQMARGADFLISVPDYKPEVRDEYRYGDFVLAPVKDFRKLETGQYIDFKAYAADKEKYFLQLLSVLLVPKGHRYNEGYDIDELQKALGEMPMTEALAIVAFFLLSWQRLIADSLNYSERAAKRIQDPMMREKTLKEIAKVRTASKPSGDGSQA